MNKPDLGADTSGQESFRPAIDVLDLVIGSDLRQFDLADDDAKWLSGLELPRGYALIGGAARDLLCEETTGKSLPVRDLDVCTFSELNPDTSPDLMADVSSRLMPDDWANGHGVKEESMSEYFATRDFTINEVAVVGRRVIATPAAVSDLKDGVIRPTSFEHNPENERHLTDRLAIKAVLLEAVLESELGEARIEGFDPRDFAIDDDDPYWTPAAPFHVALGYQKSLEYGEEVAHSFLDKLSGYGIIREEQMDDADERLSNFAEQLGDRTDFEFRGRALELLQANQILSLGQLLAAIEQDAVDHAHDLADRFGGRGREYTDESKY